jgi:uncharacterized membrane protein YdbT with pleckstrin-like domain
MPGYADSLLTRGEVVAVRGRQHWLAPIVEGWRAWALLIVSVVLVVIASRQTGEPALWLSYIGYGLLVVAVLWLGVRYWDWLNQEYLVTNRRVIKVEGIINKRAADSSLEKINDAVLDQNLVGRIFGYADLDILTAAEQAIDKFRMLGGALAFKRAMLEQKHELELELGRSPAVRVDALEPEPRSVAAKPAARAETGGVPSPLVRPAAAGPVDAGRRPMTADEITAAIEDLANLRDRGAISAEEFEAKKADLLARL